MRVCHTISAGFDDPNLVSCAGLFPPGRAPSTLGTFLRAFTFGHVRQLDAVASRVLVNLAAWTPLLVGADQVAYLDIDARHQSHLRLRQAGRGLRVLQGQRVERVARDRLDAGLGTGDRRDPAATRSDELRQGRRPPSRRRPGHRPQGRGDWADHRAVGLGVLQPRRHRRRAHRRRPVLASPHGWTLP